MISLTLEKLNHVKIVLNKCEKCVTLCNKKFYYNRNYKKFIRL